MKNKLKPYILLIPITVILIGVMGIGITTCILQSLGYFPQIGLNNITLDYYREIFRSSTFINSLFFSLKTSIISAMLAVILGILLAYFMINDKFSKLRQGILNLPIIVPHIVVVLLMFTLFSQTGLISRFLYNLNIINDPNEFISMVSDENGIGIILVYLWKGIPFITLTTYNILVNINENLENVAVNLGANKLQIFRYIMLPLAMPSIISSFIILFAFAFGSFEVPFLIGPSIPKALSVQAYIYYSSSDLMQRPIAMCMNTILSCISFVLLVIYNKLFERLYRYKL
ncbi:ABC transporter permease subunit [Romboutsia maritimum]|uniref:ABC transporter permease subunit n=1 Tax=Romboutsia maritimum TaxID=2020948 RepID=A0A371IT79_9FIRM|nr:ABC transporter permease subunit [Romboutsia maritimum]RDY23698.1 ABC transporter permease subunit [Romboutsia maritimum]